MPHAGGIIHSRGQTREARKSHPISSGPSKHSQPFWDHYSSRCVGKARGYNQILSNCRKIALNQPASERQQSRRLRGRYSLTPVSQYGRPRSGAETQEQQWRRLRTLAGSWGPQCLGPGVRPSCLRIGRASHEQLRIPAWLRA